MPIRIASAPAAITATLGAAVVVAGLTGCPPPTDSGPTTGAFVTYTLAGDGGPSRVFRLAAGGGTPEDVSAAVAGEGDGNDRRLVPSHNGSFLVMSSERFGGDGDLVIMGRDLDDAAAVQPGGVGVFIEGTPAVSDDGDTVVFARRSEAEGAAAEVDLFVTHRDGGDWSEATLISGDSSRAFNSMPALSFDDDRVFFDCGDEADPETPGSNTASCVVGVDGAGFDVVVAADTLPGARQDKTPQFPHDGTAGVLFEGGWPLDDGSTPELIWRRAGQAAPTPLSLFPNAVSPCGLRDGRTVLLWLGRPDSSGAHELTVVDDDDTAFVTLLPDVDIDDIGIGCGG